MDEYIPFFMKWSLQCKKKQGGLVYIYMFLRHDQFSESLCSTTILHFLRTKELISLCGAEQVEK